ncbi:hypothetical protein J1614_006513 [Plenodomus biglobosus]|nr:hypothetical protein J1614_006513 [Plenodomus biglobosus]
MPALHLHHLAPRLTTNEGSGGISATAIGLLVGLGLIPALILIWVVCWLLFTYPSDRNICCCVRKRKAVPPPQMMQRGSTDTSQETLYEKAGATTPPKRVYAAWARTESGTSSAGDGLDGQSGGMQGVVDRPVWRERMSGGSERSTGTVEAQQEPKRFV